jgi:hypothetical protein
VGALIGSLVIINQPGTAPPPQQGCVQPDPNQDRFVCTLSPDLGGLFSGGLPEFVGYLGLPDGLAIFGKVFWNQRLGRMYQVTGADTPPFVLGAAHFSCASIGPATLALVTQNPADYTTYVATADLTLEPFAIDPNAPNEVVSVSPRAADLIPPTFCSALVRAADDPLNVFSPNLKLDASDPRFPSITVTVPLSQVPAAYFAGTPYPCVLVVNTSAGARILTLPPITQANPDQVKSAALNAWAGRVSECYAKWVQYNPKWAIDPPDDIAVLHSWEVQAAALRAGEAVQLVGRGGSAVAGSIADRSGTARISVLLAPEAYDGQLGVLYQSPSAPAAAAAALAPGTLPPGPFVRIDVKQTQWLQRAVVETGEPLLGLAPLLVGGRAALLAVGPSGVTLYDLSGSGDPRIVARRALRGLAGAATAADSRVLGWGARGVIGLTPDPAAGDIQAARLAQGPAHGLAVVSNRPFVLRPDGLQEIDANRGCHGGVLKLHDAHLLAATPTLLLVGTDHGLELYSVPADAGAAPERVGRHDFKGLRRIVCPSPAALDRQWILEGDTSAELVDISDPAHVQSIGRLAAAGAASDYLSIRRLLLAVGPKATSFQLYCPGAVALI